MVADFFVKYHSLLHGTRQKPRRCLRETFPTEGLRVPLRLVNTYQPDQRKTGGDGVFQKVCGPDKSRSPENRSGFVKY